MAKSPTWFEIYLAKFKSIGEISTKFCGLLKISELYAVSGLVGDAIKPIFLAKLCFSSVTLPCILWAVG